MTAEPSKKKDPDMEAATGALRRAAKAARKLAYDTQTPVVYRKDGKLVEEIPVRDPDLETDSEDT